MRFLFACLFFALMIEAPVLEAQEDNFRKQRKKTWRKWKKNRQSYNPYLEKGKKDRPSAVMARENQKELKKQKRVAKRQMRRSKRRLNKR
jgi:hypothetical protein